MSTRTFPGGGGDDWDDLRDARPWWDPAIAADRDQDLDIATARHAAHLAERFGDPAVLAGELHARPAGKPRGVPARRVVASPETLIDNDIVCAARRRALSAALDRDYDTRREYTCPSAEKPAA